MIIPIQTDCDTCLDRVETTPQSQLDAKYIEFLLAQVHRQKHMMELAMLYAGMGESQRAFVTLSQGINE